MGVAWECGNRAPISHGSQQIHQFNPQNVSIQSFKMVQVLFDHFFPLKSSPVSRSEGSNFGLVVGGHQAVQGLILVDVKSCHPVVQWNRAQPQRRTGMGWGGERFKAEMVELG